MVRVPVTPSMSKMRRNTVCGALVVPVLIFTSREAEPAMMCASSISGSDGQWLGGE